jgi:hypothetical protein
LISDINGMLNVPEFSNKQILIPPQLLTSETLTLYTLCSQKHTDAHAALGAAYGSVDWQGWQNLHQPAETG